MRLDWRWGDYWLSGEYWRCIIQFTDTLHVTAPTNHSSVFMICLLVVVEVLAAHHRSVLVGWANHLWAVWVENIMFCSWNFCIAYTCQYLLSRDVIKVIKIRDFSLKIKVVKSREKVVQKLPSSCRPIAAVNYSLVWHWLVHNFILYHSVAR